MGKNNTDAAESDKVVEPNRPGSVDALNKSRRTRKDERREGMERGNNK